MKAIIYKSNTGSTASYAKLLAHELNLPVYSAEDAKKEYLMTLKLFILVGLWQVVLKDIQI